MASTAKDIQMRELKDTVLQLNKAMSEQTELIRSLRQIIEEKSEHEKVLQEQIDYLTKKLFGSSSEKKAAEIPGQLNLFNEAEQEQDPAFVEEEETTTVKSHTRKKKATHADTFGTYRRGIYPQGSYLYSCQMRDQRVLQRELRLPKL